MKPVDFLLQRDLSRYQSDLMHWSNQVQHARRHLDAFRIASFKPTPGRLAASLRGLTRADETRAHSAVERRLLTLLENLSDEDFQRDALALMRMTQGNWPSIHRQIEARRRVTH